MPRKPGQIIKKADRKFIVRVYLGENDLGKRQYINRTIHGTAKEASKVLNDMLRQRDLGTLAEPERMSMNTLLDKWLEVTKVRVKEATYREYKNGAKLYIRPKLGERQIGHIKHDDIQGLYGEMLERGLSPRMVRHTHVIVNATLNQAVRWGLLRSNPAIYAELPPKTRSQAKAMTQEQAQRFMAASQLDERYEYFAILLTTGLRPSEAMALKWSDVNFETRQLTVERTLVRPEGGGWAFEETKTGNKRSFELPDGAMLMLANLKSRAYPNPHNLIFTTIDGEPLEVSNLSSRNFRRICKVAGLEGFTMYSLRHTCATLLLLAGVHPKVVAERLGHSDITTTLNVYAHVLPTMQKEASDRLNDMLFANPKDISDLRTVN